MEEGEEEKKQKELDDDDDDEDKEAENCAHRRMNSTVPHRSLACLRLRQNAWPLCACRVIVCACEQRQVCVLPWISIAVCRPEKCH